MLPFLQALFPVIIIVALGRLLSARKVIDSAGWRGIERISYYLLFPALIIREIAHAPFETAPWKLALALIFAQLIMGSIGLLAGEARGKAAKGSIIQSNVRWTAFVSLSLSGALFGSEGLALVAISAAAMIPIANILSVWALTRYADIDPARTPNVFRDLLTNPLIIACVIGIVLNVLKLPPTGIADKTFQLLGQSVIALGLLTAGAGIDFDALKRAGLRTAFWSVIRLTGLPLAALGIGLALGLPQLHILIAVLCTATPTATNGYILAKQLGGDAPLSANLIAVQTFLSVLSMPLIYTLALYLTGG
jgi:predicted permease